MVMFTRTELKQEARRVLRLQTTPFVLATLIIFVIAGTIGGIQGGLADHYGNQSFIALFLSLVSAMVSGIFNFSFASMSLKTLDNKKISAGNAFDGFERLDSNLSVLFLMWVKTFLWTLLFIVPGIIASFRYAMSYYIIIEHPDMPANQVLAESSRMMEGHKWEFFVLGLSFILWTLLGVVTLGIAFLWVNPYMQITYTAFYNRIKSPAVVGGATNNVGPDQQTMSEDEARDAINAVMNRNAGAPVIDEEVAPVEESVSSEEPAPVEESVAQEAEASSVEEPAPVDESDAKVESEEQDNKPAE